MKRLIFILIIIWVLFIGCVANNTDSSNKDINNKNVSSENDDISKTKQKYSFGPMADLSQINDETKQYLQELINKLGNTKENQIAFNIIDGVFEEDGALVVDLFIRNGYSYSIANISCDFKIIQNGNIIATANFELDEEHFGILSSKDSRPWSLLFFPEDVINKNLKLEGATIEATNIQLEYIES